MSAPLPRTADEFLLALSDSRLLSDQQMESLRAVKPGESGEGTSWVAELVERGFLTDFQAERLLAGQGGSLVFGQYRILDRLGSGGMGHVYKAEHTVMKRVVGLKVIAGHLVKDAGAVARFHHEVELAARLCHPNIIASYDAAETNGLHFLVMEYVEGIDLGRRVKESGPLPVIEACEYIRQAALGLQHAYEHGLVHCDIKPANLLVRHKATQCPLPSPLVKILDFGLARLAGSPSASMLILGEGGQDTPFAGTPDYIAPEQARDCQAADIRSDLYSLGCTFYYLLTGQTPFPGGTWSEKLLRHQFDLVTPVDALRMDLPEQVAGIVHCLLAKSPDDRYQTPQELADALGAWHDDKSLHSAHGKTMTSTAANRPRRNLAFFSWPLAVVVAVLLGLGLAALARQSSKGAERTTPAWAVPAADSVSLASMPGKFFSRLEFAVAGARDGDTVSIRGDGPFSVTPISIQGKALTIKAEKGSHPRLQLSHADIVSGWQSLFLTNQPLTLEGLELVCAGAASPGANCSPAYLVYCEGGSLRMRQCHLSAPNGSALIVCRRARRVELRECSLVARASAICMEIDADQVSELSLVNTSVTLNDSKGAAVSLWTTLAANHAMVRVRLEKDRIIAGRVVAAAGPIEGLQVFSQGNDLTFHQALVSCAGLVDPGCWRRASPWRGQGNRYHGPGAWLLVDGKAVDVSALPAWRESLQLADGPASEQGPVSPYRTALHDPAN